MIFLYKYMSLIKISKEMKELTPQINIREMKGYLHQLPTVGNQHKLNCNHDSPLSMTSTIPVKSPKSQIKTAYMT